MEKIKRSIAAAALTALAAAMLGGCGKAEPFEAAEGQKTQEQQIQEAYAKIVEEEKDTQEAEPDGQDLVAGDKTALPSGENGGETGESGTGTYAGITDISLRPVTYGENIRYALGDSDYLITSPLTENANSKKAMSQGAAALNTLEKANPEIPFYTYFINRATDMDWYRKEGVTTFSYADYFEKELGPDTAIRTGQYRPRDVQHYMDTGYKTDFHVNHRGSYEIYQELYGMLSEDMELSDMLSPTGENDYGTLRFHCLEGGASLELAEEQMDVFKTYRFDLGDYDSYVDGKKTVIGLEKEYAEGKILRDVDFNHQFSYYGGQAGVVEFDFHHPERPNLLLISDSQGRPSRKLLAYHFNRTVFLDDVQWRSMDLEQIIQEKQIGVILFMGQESMFEWY